MWRSLNSRSSSLLRRNLLFLQNPPPAISQVFHHINKSFNYSSKSYDVLYRQTPIYYTHQSLRLFSQSSSVSEFDSENHEPGSSSSEEEIQTHDVNVPQDSNFIPEFDGNGENNGAQMSGFGKIDDLAADFADNGGAEMSGLSSVDQDSVEFEGVDFEKVEKVLSLLQSTVDESLESSLDGLELRVNEEFMVRVIETPLVPGEHLIRFYKWALGKEDVKFGIWTVLGSLVRVICNEPKKKEAYTMWDLVQESGEKESDFINVQLLNQLISAFSKLGKGKAALEVFQKFEELGCVANSDTYYLTIEALCKRSFYDWAASVCQKMIEAGMVPEKEKVGEIISSFCKGYRSKEAYAVYLAAKKNDINPPQRAVNFLISCLSKEDDTVHLAQDMLVDFSGEARKHAINPFSWVVRGLCRKKDIEGGQKLLFEMIEKGPPPGNGVFNTVINAQSKDGNLEDAKKTLKLMESRGLKPDVYSYSVIISGYAKGGLMEEACKVLAEARRKHPKLCPATFHTLIRGYCKLEQFDKAVKLLSDMKHYGVEPNVDEYNKLIQSLCLKALDYKTAEKLLEEMKQKGLYLPGITRGLISAVKELEQEAVASEEAVAVE